jgi:D-3-phosphoglycerate dehydrogenase
LPSERPHGGGPGPTVVVLDDESAVRSVETLRTALPPSWTVGHGTDAADADYLVVGSAAANRSVADSGQRLRLATLLEDAGGTLDSSAFAAHGIPVEVVQSPTLISVAEHTVMAMLVITKRALAASMDLRAGRIVDGIEPTLTTQDHYAYNWTGLPSWNALCGKTIGLVGLGVIGSHVARQLQGFGVEVLYTKPHPLTAAEELSLGVRYADLDTLLESSDCVSLHARVTPETERMMGAREFALMPSGSFFVNTARGRLVDEAALCESLRTGHLAGAALDVFEMEPLPSDSPLLGVPNTFLTPHVAGIPTSQARVLELRLAARKLFADDAQR